MLRSRVKRAAGSEEEMSKRMCGGVFGRWVAYEQENFRGRQYLWDMSDRGEYNCYDKWCAQADHISSVRAVKQVSLSQQGGVATPEQQE